MPNKVKTLLYFCILGVFIFLAHPAFAQIAPLPLPKIPGGPDPANLKGIPDLIKYIYNLSFWVVGLSVFVNVLWGGFIVFFGAAGSSSKLSEGVKKITNSVYGFVILLAAWMILNIINPNLVNNTFIFGINGGGAGPGATPTPSTPGSGGNSPPGGGQSGSWQITFYDVAQERQSGSCTIKTLSGTIIEDNADCKFLRDTTLQGTGKTLNGKYIQIETSVCKSGCRCGASADVTCVRFRTATCPVTANGECAQNLVTGASNIFNLPTNISIPILNGKHAAGQTLTGNIKINDRGSTNPRYFGPICSAGSKKHIDHFMDDRRYGAEIRQQVPGYGGASSIFEVQGTTCGGS